MPYEVLRTPQVTAAVDGDDYPLCCRHLAYAWRLFTAFPADERIVIVVLDKHDRGHNPAADLAEVQICR